MVAEVLEWVSLQPTRYIIMGSLTVQDGTILITHLHITGVTILSIITAGILLRQSI